MKEWINGLPIDKLRHWAVGSLLCISFIITALLNLHSVWAFGFCFLVAAGYEVYQYKTKTGKVEIEDILFTMITPSIAFLITLL